MRPEDLVPCHKEWLRKIEPAATQLVVNIVVRRVVPEAEMEQISRQPQATVVIHALDGAEREEEDGCTR